MPEPLLRIERGNPDPDELAALLAVLLALRAPAQEPASEPGGSVLVSWPLSPLSLLPAGSWTTRKEGDWQAAC